jgi:methionyl-tRNA formyltransferase
LRSVFFGTPEFAVPSLEALAAAGLAPARVISQPSRPAGRGHRLQDPPVVEAARRLGLEVVQVESVRDPGFLADLRALAPDVAIVVAFGQIFRQELLDLPRLGCFNLHASLLPRFRGAAPIQAAVAAGDAVTGITVQRMTRGLDAGPVVARAELPILPGETAEELSPRLAALGAGAVVDVLRRLRVGPLAEEPQDDALATFAPRLTKADGAVDWALTAKEIADRWRGYQAWPGLHAQLRGEPLKLVAVHEVTEEAAERAPGELLGPRGAALAVACGGGTILAIERAQRAGRAAISGADLWRGEHLRAGELLA